MSRAGAEIYIAGLNSAEIPLPTVATDTKAIMEREKLTHLKRAAVALMGHPNPDPHTRRAEPDGDFENIDDLTVLREGLCFRPWVHTGLPIVTRIDDRVGFWCVKTTDGGGVFVATGHGPWEISLSLGTGKVMAEMVCGLKTSGDVSRLGFLGAPAGKPSV
jgi:hypothetical protein